MRWLILPLLAASMLAADCTSCSSNRPGDTGTEPDLDGDITNDADAEANDSDAEAYDSDVEDEIPPEDADISDGAITMDPVEIPRNRPGLDCGRGCTQVSFADMVWAYYYDVGGRYIVYKGDTTRSPHIYDLESSKEYLLVGCDPHVGDLENCLSPAVDKNIIIFSSRLFSDISDTPEITLWRYKIGDSYRYPLVTRRMTDYTAPLINIDVHQDMVSWWDSAIDPLGLYAMSLDGGEVIGLTRNECPCYGAPQLWGREVVYESTRSWHDIWVVNIDTLEERDLNNDRVEQWTPAFDGRWVVWSDGRNDPCPLPSWDLCNTDIYGMAMPDGEIEPLCDHPAVQTHPDVHLGFVAWEDFRNAEDPNDGNARDANIDIYLLDLDTRREVQVTNLPGPERMPRIWDHRLFYVAEDLIGQQAIFMIDLDEAGLL